MQQGHVRIIAGKWRGRRLQVPDVKDLRPTPDRVRETLFNWLSPVIHGAHCLDLFTGTGVLGFEALSRGAAHVTMVDQSRVVVNNLLAEQKAFEAENAKIYQASVPKQLQAAEHRFDIVFLDPPYQSGLLIACCEYLEEQALLADQAYIYLEAQQAITAADLPEGWDIIKSGKAGQVFYHLAYRDKS